jgi:hypothetical protein
MEEEPTAPPEQQPEPQPEPLPERLPEAAPDLAAPSEPTVEHRERKRRTGLLLLAIVMGVLILAGAASAMLFVLLRGSGDVLAKDVPSDAAVYATMYLNPSASQKLNLERLGGHFPGLQGKDAQQIIDELTSRALSRWNLSASDVEAWLGSQIAVAMRYQGQQTTGGATQVVVLVASTDDAAALASLQKARNGSMFTGYTWSQVDHNGVTVATGSGPGGSTTAYAVNDGAVILGDSASAVDQVIDTQAGTTANLAESQSYKDTVSKLPRGELAFAYMNYGQLMNQIPGGAMSLGGLTGSAGLTDAVRTVGFALSAEPTGIQVKMAELIDRSKLTAAAKQQLSAPSGASSVLSWTPQDSYGVYTFPNAGALIQQTVEQLGSLGGSSAGGSGLGSQLGLGGLTKALSGDAGVVIGPTSDGSGVTGALLLATSDPSAMQATLDQLSMLALGLAEGGSVFGGSSGGHGSGSLPAPTIAPSPTAPMSFDTQPSPPPLISPPTNPNALTWRTTTYSGATIRYLSGGTTGSIHPAYTVTDGMAIIGLSLDEVEAVIDAHGGSNVTSTANFKSATAQTGVSKFLLYVDLEAILQKERSTTSSQEAANLAPLKSLAMSQTSGSDYATAVIFLSIG